jgi:hypothetical protein
MVILVEANDVLNRFIRFGKLDSFQIQNVHAVSGKETSSYHIAPEKRGFYAMPLKYQEMFLIGSLEDTQKDVFPKNKNFKLPDDPNDMSLYDPSWDADTCKAVRQDRIAACKAYWNAEIEREKKINYIKHNLIRHSFTLKDSDLIWHHLHFYNAVPINEIERRVGDWVLTSVGTFKRAIGKAIAKTAKEWEMHRGNVNVAKLDKDAFEVFIPAGTVK